MHNELRRRRAKNICFTVLRWLAAVALTAAAIALAAVPGVPGVPLFLVALFLVAPDIPAARRLAVKILSKLPRRMRRKIPKRWRRFR